jgi:hypothetical protein
MTVIEWTVDQINSRLFELFGNVVQSGPFAGILIGEEVAWKDGNIGLKLMGVYEHELHPHIAKLISKQPSNIVNIGCAEGYYAVGMAYAIPGATVTAIDINGKSLELCAANAMRNRVADHVITNQKSFKPQETNAMIVDCEGCELELFTNSMCLRLQNCDLIVECHNEGIINKLVNRFKNTHDIELVYPDRKSHTFVTEEENILIHEHRPDNMAWLVAWRATWRNI